MIRGKFYILGMILCSLFIAYGCQRQGSELNKNNGNTFSVKGSVREMSITPESPEFPEYEGKKEFISYCAICHSLRYISMQPDFPRKTWEAEVNKMVGKYKAPIDSVTCSRIVSYLVHIKSKP